MRCSNPSLLWATSGHRRMSSSTAFQGIECQFRLAIDDKLLLVTQGGDPNYDRGSLMKVLLVGVTILLAVAWPVFAQQAPPPSEKAKQIEALVTKAAALIDKNGKAAFAEFRKRDSERFHGDTYVFVYDLKANVLLNPAFPQREGTNVTGQKDAKGKLLHQEIIRVAEIDRSGWVDYLFPKPGQTVPSQKWTFVKRVTIDGTPGLVASGFFPN